MDPAHTTGPARMASTSLPRPRPMTPLEEDLQRLYNEVWQGFAEEEPIQTSARDLETVYDGYANDQTTSMSGSTALQPHQSVSREASSHQPAVESSNVAVMSTIPSPRRRLPPTPTFASPFAPISMPEPHPYRSPDVPAPEVYPSYPSTASFESIRRPTEDSFSEVRRLPPDPGYMNGSNTWSNGNKTSVSSMEYQSQLSIASTTSYTTSNSLGSNIKKLSVEAPLGAPPPPPVLPPKPTAYPQDVKDARNPFQPSYDTYDYEPAAANGYSSAKATSSNPYDIEIAPPPPPPKPASSPKPHPPSQYANVVQTSPLADVDMIASSSGSSYFEDADAPYHASSSKPRYLTLDDEQEDDLPPQLAEEEWDEETYMYADRKKKRHVQADDTSGMPSGLPRRPTEMLQVLGDYEHEPVDIPEASQNDDAFWDDEEEDDSRFVNFSLLSNIAMQLRDKVPRGTHVKGSIEYPRAFTGKDIVSAIQSQIQRELAINHGISTNDRRVSLQAARSLQSQLFFFEVDSGRESRALQDGVEDVYMFLDEQEGGSGGFVEELPTGVITMLTKCYSASCGEGTVCYSHSCPRKGNEILNALPDPVEQPISPKTEEWSNQLDPIVLATLPAEEISRQTIIHKLILREEQYLCDLDIVESAFIKPLRNANPPIMLPQQVDDLIDDIFGNILDLRETNRHLLEVMYVRQREEGPIIQRVGDLFLGAATEFRYAYPTYIGHLPVSEKRLKEELESNTALRQFLEQCSRQLSSQSGDASRFDLKTFLNRPSEHLMQYLVHLEAVKKETAEENPDSDFLSEAIVAIRNLQSVAQLRTFQAAMGKGVAGKWEWHDLVPPEVRQKLSKQEAKRQSVIFELIKGEMAYVKDLENITHIYVNPLRTADPPIIPRERLEEFIEEVFHNYMEIYERHKRLVEKFHEIQREQHPTIYTVTACMFDAALNWREAYMEYIPNYPMAAYRIDDEKANNLTFKTFHDQCTRHADAHRLDMKNFIYRPIPRLLRYDLLLKGIMDESPPDHEDLEEIPNVVEVIKALGKESEPGVQSAKNKVEVWRYNANLVFKQGEAVDMDLLDKSRQLIHLGKLLRQPESGLEFSGWSELHVVLFDNYLVMTKPKEKDGVNKYHVNRRPIPLDLLSLVNFTDPPTQRNTGLLRGFAQKDRTETSNVSGVVSPDAVSDARHVYPLTLHHNGRSGGPCILYAETAHTRAEWKRKLEEALGLRKIVQESNKVFEIEYLSRDTFVMPSLALNNAGQTWTQDNTFTGKVTCSVPFNTPDGRALVAIGCSEGVWIGFRHDPKSMRRVLLLKMVTQCAMLEEFGIFLVLADKALFAYHIEALVPSPSQASHASQAMPQKISGTKDVHFFSVGVLQGRTLIVYMKKKGMDSIFRVLEPVGDKINERVRAAAGFGTRLGFRSAKSEWFRVFRDFFLPSDSFDVVFLKARIAILCAKGFEIMNLQDFDTISLPQKEDPRHAQLLKRCENARPIGMFRSTDEEFLLCYDEFGLYVDKHGDPSRSGNTIEWEGTAERVASHFPYVLLFDSRFIEIRHILTGRLAQIISGTEVRCTWDGRGVNLRATTSASAVVEDVQEAQVHFVMNSTDPVTGQGPMRAKNIVQHVCELIPTVTLFPDGTSAAPTTLVSPTLPTPSSYTQSPTSSHHYNDSYSSHHSYGSSIAPRIQIPYPPPQGSTQLDHQPSVRSTYTSSQAQTQSSHSTLLPQRSYRATQTSQHGYIQPQHAPTGLAPQQGYAASSSFDAQYYQGGY